MNWLMRNLLAVAAAIMIFGVGFSAYAATFYPDDGDLWYNETNFADSTLRWAAPRGWSRIDPGYEHDLALRSYYFAGCTSWTDLPNGYDDCPTAGATEPSTLWSFSFGSFHAKNVVAGRWYYGSWNFGGYPSAASTDFKLIGQEVSHDICSWDSIWCMAATGQYQPHLNGYLYRDQEYYGSW